MFDSSVTGQEDCLLLNIYVPAEALNKGKQMPVMVWIHGGALIHGSNRFDEQGPQDYMDREVIIVTINYRLGPFGFLSLGNDEVFSNAGFYDQNLALQWVNQNIEAFGGDQNSVTLFGESAGALSVNVQFLSPMSQGLFQRIILQSCSTEAPGWQILNESLAMHYGNVLIEKIGCSKATDSLSCLQRKSMDEILSLTYEVNPNSGAVWMGVPDGKLITENPSILLENGQFDPSIEVLVSTTKD